MIAFLDRAAHLMTGSHFTCPMNKIVKSESPRIEIADCSIHAMGAVSTSVSGTTFDCQR